MAVTALAYLGLGVTDCKSWHKFAVQDLGLMDAGQSGQAQRLRMDGRPWRIALHQSASNDLMYAGFEVKGGAEGLAAISRQFEASGVPYRSLTGAELHDRGVSAGLTVQDPDGLTLELVAGLEDAGTPFASSRSMHFVTGRGGLGHIVLSAREPERSAQFYQRLGFSISDYIDMAVGPGISVRIIFMHCNTRHHSLALAPIPMPGRLDHIMLEVKTVDDVIETYNRLLRQGYSMKRHLGRHPNDGMLSFYVTTPAGFDLELGCDGIEISEPWEIKVYDKISDWGHESALTP